jgi:tetratricopeptide (TPR) repeat protein
MRGYDEELRRDVAIKVPHRHRIAQPVDVEAYLAEARILANLDHHHIVPVHDVGRTEDGLCYVVSKFIEGSDLATRLKQSRLPLPEAVELVATVDICRQVLGENHPDTARGYNNVAFNLNAQGKYAAAGPLFQRALEIRRQVVGEDHPDTAASYHNLAGNLNAQGKYAPALVFLEAGA